MKIIITIIIALAVCGTTLFAGEKHDMKPYQGSEAFENLKKLVGTWTGVMKMGEEKMDYTVSYQVIAGGSAILEKSFPDTPKEMVSLYHEDYGKVVMTHYCMLGNQPEMKLIESTDKVFRFDFTGGANIDPDKSMYMSSVVFTLTGENEMTQAWGMTSEGKEESKNVLALTRSR